MKKGLLSLLVLMVLCIGGLTGCSFLGEKEDAASNQQTNEKEEKQKELESEETNKAIKTEEPQASDAKETEKETNKAVGNKEDSTEETSKSKETSNDKKTETTTDKVEVPVSQVNWGSAWTRDINTDRGVITISEANGDTLKFSINATHTNNAEAARAGNINVGDVEGTAKVSGNVATQTTKDEDTGCRVKMTNHQSYIQVEAITDCSMAGGLGVSFDGKYQKGNIPETDWWKEDETNDATSDASGEESEEPVNEEAPVEDEIPVEDETPAEDTQSLLTHEQAEELIRKMKGYSAGDPMHSVYYSNDDENGNYVIHDYEDVKDDPNTPYSEAHEATLGWYSVNPKTGEIRDLILNP
ncbi:hypothetical protein [Priestia aryabhattai]